MPKDIVQERYQRLVALQEQIALEENRAQIGNTVELLVATGEGRKDSRTARMSGRARDGRLVHFTPASSRYGLVTSSPPWSPVPRRIT
ncbi:(Dimethylallyl)adenosine tRNA methylthiotransferase miaB domain protein [Mycobacterium xenopi 4042]|uniref:(Dimethylallyl)adenosine tRNA methylthiotransferase miaB domain protein n=1 Tax=Mycobacterium xenopi 4042 TaxID=1299334 RepID=X8CE59_MYCXE|nr:(Dimethylallyl)adenosine tRNA methylthiotransferase miaB domain protein [Mycobacterium xenopi 4042]